MTRAKHPASSFGAHLHDYLREGAVREVRIKCNTEKRATHLMHRLNALRKTLKDENHSSWEEYYRCGVHRDPADRSIVVLRPRDSEFPPITPTAPPPLPSEPKIVPFDPKDRDDPADVFLRDILKKD